MIYTQYTASAKQILLLTVACIVIFSGCVKAQVTWSQLAEIEVPSASRTITYGTAETQTIDVFDANGGGNGSTVMLIHGGCWLSQYDRYYMSHLAKSLAESGSTVYNIGYRRVGDDGGGYPGTFDDVRAAYDAITSDVNQQAYDPDNITIVGHSAGGHLALWLASIDSSVRRVVGLAAISDLSDYARGTGSCQTAAPRLMGGSPDDVPAAYSSTDPMLIGNPKAEIVLISAEKDAIVPPAFNEGYIKKINAQHIILSNVGHFDLVAPISPVWKEVLSVIGDR
jgi:acetyl esterase/lipase